MDVKALRRSFVAKVSWGPTKISFSDAIMALDHSLLESGFGEVVAPASYSPVPDAMGIPTQFKDAGELQATVMSMARRGKSSSQKDDMVLDSEQENEKSLSNEADS